MLLSLACSHSSSSTKNETPVQHVAAGGIEPDIGYEKPFPIRRAFEVDSGRRGGDARRKEDVA
jgi:hypothetical protein